MASYSLSKEDRHECAMQCLANGGEACCYDNCFAERYGIYVNDKINTSGFIATIINGKSDTPGLQDLAENAVKECEKGYAVKYPFSSQYEYSYTCELPDKLYMISKCILSYIFLNCPEMKAGNECEEMKKSMEKCQELTTPIPTEAPLLTKSIPTQPPTTTTTILTTLITSIYQSSSTTMSVEGATKS